MGTESPFLVPTDNFALGQSFPKTYFSYREACAYGHRLGYVRGALMAPNSSGGRRPLGVFRPYIVRLNCNLAVRLGCREPNLERGVLFSPLYILRRDKYLSSRFYVCDVSHIIYNRRSEPIFRKNIVVDSTI